MGMNACFYEGPIGRYILEERNGYLTHLWLGDNLTSVSSEMLTEETPLLKEAHLQLEAYFARQLKQFDLPLQPLGTAFQLKLWKILSTIPYGETITYGEEACLVGNPWAARAVGRANGCNPLPVFIPCHRVVGVGGKLTGYSGGVDIKRCLLQIEGVCGFE